MNIRPGTKGRKLETGTTDKKCSLSGSLTGLYVTIFLMHLRTTCSATQDRTIWRASYQSPVKTVHYKHPTGDQLRQSITNMPVDKHYKDHYSVHTIFIQKILGCAKLKVNDTKDGQKAKIGELLCISHCWFSVFLFCLQLGVLWSKDTTPEGYVLRKIPTPV